MARAHEIEAMWEPRLWQLKGISASAKQSHRNFFRRTYPRSIKSGTKEVQNPHQRHPLQRQTPLLHRKTVEQDAVRDEEDGRQPKATVHQRAVFAERWTQKTRV